MFHFSDLGDFGVVFSGMTSMGCMAAGGCMAPLEMHSSLGCLCEENKSCMGPFAWPWGWGYLIGAWVKNVYGGGSHRTCHFVGFHANWA